MSWHNPHLLYRSFERVRGLVRYLDNNDYDSQRTRFAQVVGRPPWTKPGPEEYLRRCMVAAYIYAQRAGINDESFVRGAQAMIDYIRQHTTVYVTAEVIR